MADRFPSLEDFDFGAQTQAAEPTTGGDDFLSREKALLGDDADQFTSSNDNAAFVEADDDDLLGGGNGGMNNGDGTSHGEEVTEFESSFPALENTNMASNPQTNITSSYQSTYTAPSSEPEPEVITQWRERRDAALTKRDEASAQRKTDTVKAAQQAIDDFYENYNVKKDKTISQTRREAEEFMNSRDDTSAGGTSWERIAKLVDLSGKGAKGGASGTGKGKFRDLLMSLKKDEKAPGAGGT